LTEGSLHLEDEMSTGNTNSQVRKADPVPAQLGNALNRLLQAEE